MMPENCGMMPENRDTGPWKETPRSYIARIEPDTERLLLLLRRFMKDGDRRHLMESEVKVDKINQAFKDLEALYANEEEE